MSVTVWPTHDLIRICYSVAFYIIHPWISNPFISPDSNNGRYGNYTTVTLVMAAGDHNDDFADIGHLAPLLVSPHHHSQA